MNITLKQRDIELALKLYLSEQGVALKDRPFNVQFTAGRKGSGLSAAINIGEATALVEAAVEATVEVSASAAPDAHPDDVFETIAIVEKAEIAEEAKAFEPKPTLAAVKPPAIFFDDAPDEEVATPEAMAEAAPSAAPAAVTPAVSLFA